MRHLLSILLVVLISGAAASALAQPSTDEIAALAERAKEKLVAGDNPGALADYRKVVEMMGSNPSFEVLANYSHAAFQLRLLAESATALREADRRMPISEPDYDALKKKFADRMAEILPHIAQLRVTAEPDGAEVLVDGASQGRAPLADTVFVMPGSREIQGQLAGYEHARELVTVQAGETASVSLSLSPAVAASPPPPNGAQPAPAEGISSARLGVGITGVGLGIVGVAAAIVLGVTASDRASNVEQLTAEVRAIAPNGPEGNHCGPGSPALSTTGCQQIDENAREEMRFRAAAIATGVAGGAFLIGGILTLALPVGDGDHELGFQLGPSAVQLRGRF